MQLFQSRASSWKCLWISKLCLLFKIAIINIFDYSLLALIIAIIIWTIKSAIYSTGNMLRVFSSKNQIWNSLLFDFNRKKYICYYFSAHLKNNEGMQGIMFKIVFVCFVGLNTFNKHYLLNNVIILKIFRACWSKRSEPLCRLRLETASLLRGKTPLPWRVF